MRAEEEEVRCVGGLLAHGLCDWGLHWIAQGAREGAKGVESTVKVFSNVVLS